MDFIPFAAFLTCTHLVALGLGIWLGERPTRPSKPPAHSSFWSQPKSARATREAFRRISGSR